MKYYQILERATKKITEYFNSVAHKVYTITELGKILLDQRKSWGLSSKITRRDFIEYMLLRTKLENHIFKFPNVVYQRFTWGPGSIYSIILSWKKMLHFTHYTATYLHNLVDRVPKSIFVTSEQSPKRINYQLSQLSIDNAMTKQQRITRNVASYGRRDIHLLNGKHTENTGVIAAKTTGGVRMPVTDLERTLIDITVRPEYAGGPFDVLEAYKRAAKNVSCDRMVSYLNKINYVYPYHQSVGFYMETSKAYSSSQIETIRTINRDFDFYLTYNIPNVEYSERWKIFYPIEMTFI